jgi:hypothetical protein
MLNRVEIGGGQVDADHSQARARLTLPAVQGRAYCDAQLDDYHDLPRRRFPNRPPVHLRLRARASHPAPIGTLGFGFWNDPFALNGGVLAAPSAVWFFYASPPSDMVLVEGVPGQGWKAATLDTGRYPAALIAPAAVVAIALTRLPGLGSPVMAAARRLARAQECALDDVALTEWHAYELDWLETEAVFRVDGVERLRASAPPRGPLGFVTWIDNQYAVASRAGQFGFGVCPLGEEQWLELEALTISRG